jgi:ABC-type multidrug transport system permease subunit
MKVLTIARKALFELWREPLLWGLELAFPVLMIALYYVAFGETDQGMAKFLAVLVINEDSGVAALDCTADVAGGPCGGPWQAGSQLVDALRATEWEGKPVLAVSEVADRREAENVLRERKAALLLVIPPDFTRSLLGASTGAPPATVSLLGDPTSDSFVFAQSFVDDLVRQFARQAAGGESAPSPVAYEFVAGTGTKSDFDFGIPGVIVFGVMLVVISTAETLVRENVGGTLRRLRLTRARAKDLLLGVAAAQMLVAALIMPVTFAAALAFGFRGNGSLLLAIGIGLLFSLSAVGLGLITACFARNDGEAANLGAAMGVLMVLVSGAMYPMPNAPLFTVAGRTIQVYDLLPPAHAGKAMQRVLIYGDGPGAIAYELVALAVLSAMILAVGVVLYRRLQMRKL